MQVTKRRFAALSCTSIAALFLLLSVCFVLWSMAREMETLSEIYARSGNALDDRFVAPIAFLVVLGGMLAWVAQYVWRKQSFLAAKIFLSLTSGYTLVMILFERPRSGVVFSDVVWAAFLVGLLAWVVWTERGATNTPS